MTCPLCSSESSLFHADKGVNWELYGLPKKTIKDLNFFQCGTCALVFKDPAIRLNELQEKVRYDLHVNQPNDPVYEEFLTTLIEPILPRLKPGAVGLDFGCGIEPAMQKLVESRGFSCSSYDPYFHKDDALLQKKYDFITVCETAEHFYSPSKEFELLFGLLNPHGLLGIKTKRVPKKFGDWWYHRDPTHVVFYSRQTFEWLSHKYKTSMGIYPNDVVWFTTP